MEKTKFRGKKNAVTEIKDYNARHPFLEHNTIKCRKKIIVKQHYQHPTATTLTEMCGCKSQGKLAPGEEWRQGPGAPTHGAPTAAGREVHGRRRLHLKRRKTSNNLIVHLIVHLKEGGKIKSKPSGQKLQNSKEKYQKLMELKVGLLKRSTKGKNCWLDLRKKDSNY